VAGDQPGIAIANINMALIRDQRRNMPVQQHRKL
jgi:hypothetical protein